MYIFGGRDDKGVGISDLSCITFEGLNLIKNIIKTKGVPPTA